MITSAVFQGHALKNAYFPINVDPMTTYVIQSLATIREIVIHQSLVLKLSLGLGRNLRQVAYQMDVKEIQVKMIIIIEITIDGFSHTYKVYVFITILFLCS